MTEVKKLLIAGGGTGGHLFPGLGVAEEWRDRGGEVLFVGTPRGMEKTLVPHHGFRLRLMTVSILKGTGLWQKIKTILSLPSALLQGFRILKEEAPDQVIGIGGYASGPVCVAAFLKRIPLAIMEQNTLAGLANRLLGKLAKKVFVGYEKGGAFFNPKKVVITGNPVLKNGAKLAQQGDFATKIQPTLLVCGGSQGAHRVNEMMLAIYEQLLQQFPTLSIIHQTGERDFKWFEAELNKKGLGHKVECAPFYHDMAVQYKRATLVVARSGAGTMTDLALWGLPSLLIPFPFSADGHQIVNAEVAVSWGGAVMAEEKDLNAEKLFLMVRDLLQNSDRLLQMSRNMKKHSPAHSAEMIVDELLKNFKDEKSGMMKEFNYGEKVTYKK